MAITVHTFGSGAISSGAEYSVPNGATYNSSSGMTDDGVYQVFLNLADIFIGDELRIRIYEKVGSGSTQRIVYQHIITHLDNPGQLMHWVSPALILLHGWDVTLETTAAGPITVSWAIRKVA